MKPTPIQISTAVFDAIAQDDVDALSRWFALSIDGMDGARGSQNLWDRDDRSPALAAVEQDRPRCLAALAELGLDLNSRHHKKQGDRGWSLTAWAAKAGALGCLRALHERGADLRALSPRLGPAHVASYFNQPEALRFLILHGAPLDQTDREGMTPLDVARMQANASCVQVILDAPALLRADRLSRCLSQSALVPKEGDAPKSARL
jgi:hypothetical protein